MAVFYVNSVTGNNSNNGTSASLAKLTLAGADSVASTGDTIYCTGIFYEIFPVNKIIYWIDYGYCEINGNKTLNAAGTGVPIGTAYRNLSIVNFTSAGLICLNSGTSPSCFNVIFANQPIGINVGGSTTSLNVTDCQFYNHSISAVKCSSAISLVNSVFLGNSRSLDCSATATLAYKCIFRDSIMIDTTTTISSLSDYNCYDFTFGKCRFNSIDYTDIDSWKAAIGSPRDANSISQTPSVGDIAKLAGRTQVGANLLTQGPNNTPIGLNDPAVTISNNTNSSLWTGGVFSNTEIDGNGNLVVSPNQTSGSWKSDIIDFTTAKPAKRLEIKDIGQFYPTSYLDFDTGDSPHHFNVRIRGSNTSFIKTDSSPSWVAIPRGAEIGGYMTNTLRYWQVEITMREF